jgi:hypothetical protein
VFRSTTYDEWIQNIADAFIDPYDLPDGKITDSYFVARKGTKIKSDIESEWVSKYTTAGNLPLRPGAPQWGLGSQAAVYVIAIVLPNVAQFGAWTSQLQGFFSLFGLGLDLQGDSTSEFSASLKKYLNDATDNFKENGTDLLNSFKANAAIINRSPIPGGSGLDFYGVSLESLVPKLFNVLRNLTASLEALVKNVDATLSGLFQDLLDGIDAIIGFIKSLVALIDDLLTLLDTFSSMDIKMLKVTSTKGVADIYDQLLSATEFPDQDNQKNQFIIGLAFAAGAPGPDSSAFDFGKYIKNQKKTFDEEKGELKDMYTGSDSGQSGLNKIMSKFL